MSEQIRTTKQGISKREITAKEFEELTGLPAKDPKNKFYIEECLRIVKENLR